MKQIQYIVILVALGSLLGCASGKNALKRGDYDKAVIQAIKRLRSNDDHKKASSTLRDGYAYALEQHRSNIDQKKLSADPLKWEGLIRDYEQVNYLADELMRCPGCRDVVRKPVRYDAELASAKQQAAEVRYQLANTALANKSNREKAKEAHQHLLIANQYIPGYKDVEDKLQEALYFATLRVVVEDVPAPTRMFRLRHEFFVNKINEYLHNSRINDYVQFYTPQEAEANQLEFVDHVIRMEFDRFSLGNVFSSKDTREVSRDSVVIAEQEGEKIYGTVKAKLTIHEKAITGSGLLDFQVYDNEKKKVITHEKFPSEYTWAISWATYNGDERALTDEELDLVNTIEASIPNPQWMFEAFTAPLYDQVTQKIRNYYRRY